MTLRQRHALLVALVCVAVNGGSLFPGFIHDDHKIIEQNEQVSDPTRLPEIFKSSYWSAADVQVPNLYRPLTILSFALERSAHGLRPFGFRVIDLLLHALNALLVLRLAARAFPAGPPGTPLVAGLLFAVHPVHTEVLGEIVGRSELLACACVLGSILVYLRARAAEGPGEPSTRRLAPRALALALFAAAFLSKENAVVAPALLLLADLLLVRRRPDWTFHAASFLTLGALLAVRRLVLGSLNPAGSVHFIDNPIAHLPFIQGRLTALDVVARYAGLLVWPRAMSIDYSYRAIPPASGPLQANVLIGAVLVLAWVAGLVHLMRARRSGIAFGLGLAGAAFAPVANLLFPIGTIMAERLLYLPSAGLCLAAAALIGSNATTPVAASASAGSTARSAAPTRATAVRLAVVLILAALAARSVVRLRDWRDDYTIFKAALRVAPESVRALFNYGSACEERGEDAPAVEAYRKALEIWPGFADASYNLAGVLARQKRWPEAVDHYREALGQQPANVRYLVNLAHSLVALDRHAEARDLLRRALDVDPRSTLAYTELGAAELGLGDARAALAAYEEASRLSPSNVDFLRNLGIAQREVRDPRAAATFRAALDLRPGDPDLLDGLGLALADAGDAAEAAVTLRRAVAERPGHPVYRYHLARALDASGDLDGALAQYEESIRLAPTAPAPYKGLGELRARRGDRAGALVALERALALDPKGQVMDETGRALLTSLRRDSGSGRR